MLLSPDVFMHRRKTLFQSIGGRPTSEKSSAFFEVEEYVNREANLSEEEKLDEALFKKFIDRSHVRSYVTGYTSKLLFAFPFHW